MPAPLTGSELALRLGLAFVAGVLVGMNRWEDGQAAGLRTTVLVCLAAAVAMIQADLLLVTRGKFADSFAVMDVMRLPLGILSGMGFIGAGAILRRGRRVQGVTTAATLWLVTVIGLCFGGGQMSLGLTALALAVAVLWGLKWLEHALGVERRGVLTLRVPAEIGVEREILGRLSARHIEVRDSAASFPNPGQVEITWEIQWKSRRLQRELPEMMYELAHHPQVSRLKWTPHRMSR